MRINNINHTSLQLAAGAKSPLKVLKFKVMMNIILSYYLTYIRLLFCFFISW